MNSIKYASFGRRSLSFMIDDFIVSAIFIVIFYNQIIMLTTPDLMTAFIAQNVWVLFVLKILYHTFFIGYNGATVGKWVMGLRAVNEENPQELISFPMAFLRALIRVISENLLYIPFLYALVSPKKQTLHDKLTKCVVIDVR